MSRVLIIDSELKSINEFKQNLLNLNPQIIIESFLSLQDLDLITKKLNEEELIEFYKFDLIILDYSLVDPKAWAEHLSFFKQQNTLKGVICFSTYDRPDINRKHIFNLEVYNVLYKPFDPLILKESLNIALKAGKNSKTVEIKPQSAKAFVAILKEIELISICELGFVTMNEGEIPQYSYSKYFSEIFSYGKKQSVWAQCLMSIPVPNKPGYFINKFQYVAIEPAALMTIRKYIQTNKKKQLNNALWNLAPPQQLKKLSIALIDTVPEKSGTIIQDIETYFENVKVDFIKIDTNKTSKPAYQQYDCVINLNDSNKFDQFKNYFPKETLYFMFSQVSIAEDRMSEITSQYRDVFVSPLDKSYFLKKLKIHLQDLKYKEVPDLLNISCTEKFKAANLVKISEICELYLTFNYHRELPNGTFREFVFINEDENQIIELPGFCNFTEKNKPVDGKKTAPTYFHQFVFWGMTDHYLKQIRIWLLHNHILQNR